MAGEFNKLGHKTDREAPFEVVKPHVSETLEVLSDRTVTIPSDKINLEFVLGNKVMVGTVNANREYFEMGVRDMAHSEADQPGWLARVDDAGDYELVRV